MIYMYKVGCSIKFVNYLQNCVRYFYLVYHTRFQLNLYKIVEIVYSILLAA